MPTTRHTLRLVLALICLLAALGTASAQRKITKSKRQSKKATRTEATQAEKAMVVAPAKQTRDLSKDESMPLPRGIEPFEQPITREEKGKTTEIGKVDWTTQYIEATGQSVIDLDRYKNPAQAKALAIRGATVVAQRNLLEIVKGVNVQGETTVEDMMTTRDFIVTRVEGIVKGATPVGSPVEKDGLVEVRLRMPLYTQNGLANAVYDQIPNTPTTMVTDPSSPPNSAPDAYVAPPAADPSTATAAVPEKGIAFAMNGKPFDPSLFPVVTDENGNVVLDMKGIYDPSKGNFPKIVKATKEAMQQAGFKKGVEVLNVLDAENGKIRISNADAGKFPWQKILNVAKTVGKFLLLFI